MHRKKSAKACSNHADKTGVAYCRECKSFLCQECETKHNTDYGKEHKTVSASSITDINLQGGKCPEHSNYTLDSFCNDCIGNANIFLLAQAFCSIFSFLSFKSDFNSIELCCGECKFEGKHRGHNVLSIETSKNFMKEKLESNIEAISGELHTLEELSRKAEEKVDEIATSKEEVRDLIQKNFDEIRRTLDEKEAQVLKNLEEIDLGDENVSVIISDIHNEIENLSETITSGNELLDEWDTKEITSDYTTKIASIVNKFKGIEETKRLKSTFSEKLSYELLVKTDDFMDEAAGITQQIKGLTEVEFRKTYTTGPTNLSCNEVNPFFVSLEWDRNERDDKYIVITRKEGEEWDHESSFECNENRTIIASLNSDTTYNFRIKAKRGTILSNWSDTLTAKTTPFTFENVALTLFTHCDNGDKVFISTLKQMEVLTEDGIKSINNQTIISAQCLFYFPLFSS